MLTVDVNGTQHSVEADADTPLLWVLRDELGLTGTKFGCGLGLCGACSVLLNGKAVRSCVIPVSAVAGQAVVTIEGLSPDRSHPVQQAWISRDCPPVRLLPVRDDPGDRGATSRQAESHGRRDRHGDHQHLPLRHLQPRPPGHTPGRPAAGKRQNRPNLTRFESAHDPCTAFVHQQRRAACRSPVRGNNLAPIAQYQADGSTALVAPPAVPWSRLPWRPPFRVAVAGYSLALSAREGDEGPRVRCDLVKQGESSRVGIPAKQVCKHRPRPTK